MNAAARLALVSLAGVVVSACAVASDARPEPQDPAVATSTSLDAEAAERGRRLTTTACAGCHATGMTGPSPFADAPPLRDIVRRRSLEDLESAFAEGLVTSHPAMPTYVFRASEIDDVIAWLESLQARQ